MRAGRRKGGAVLSVLLAVGGAAACAETPPPLRFDPTSTVGVPSTLPVTVTTLDEAGAPGADVGGWFTPVDAGAAVAQDAGRALGSASDAGLCGCSLCAPAFSDDACSADADCAPATPCHAMRCVAKAKAERRKPGMMCTEIVVCNSVDANPCGCVAGKCALHPR